MGIGDCEVGSCGNTYDTNPTGVASVGTIADRIVGQPVKEALHLGGKLILLKYKQDKAIREDVKQALKNRRFRACIGSAASGTLFTVRVEKVKTTYVLVATAAVMCSAGAYAGEDIGG